MVYLWYTSFGSRHRYDLIVNLHWARSVKELLDLRRPFRHDASLGSVRAGRKSHARSSD